MSKQTGHIFILLFGIACLVVLNSAYKVKDSSAEIKENAGQGPFETKRNAIKIESVHVRDNAHHNGNEQSHQVLEKRGHKNRNYVGSGVVHTPGNASPSKGRRVSVSLGTTSPLRNSNSNLNAKNGVLSSRGGSFSISTSSSSKGSSVTSMASPDGFYIKLDQQGIYARVISPVEQKIEFDGYKVYSNSRVICNHIPTAKKREKKYQIRTCDGSMWYTNMIVGRKMWPKEIEEFTEEEEKIKTNLQLAESNGDLAKLVGDKIKEEVHKQKSQSRNGRN